MEWEEFKLIYGYNTTRATIMEGMEAALRALKKYRCRRVYMDGSFVTTKEEPNDFDACWDPDGMDVSGLITEYPCFWDLRAPRNSQKELFKGELFPSTTPAESGTTFLDFFQRDRDLNRKGIVKIELKSLV